MSVLILSRELSIFVRVFLMRSAVNLADGFWNQHSFISLAIEVKVWNLSRGTKSISTFDVSIIKTGCNAFILGYPVQGRHHYVHIEGLMYLRGLKTICLVCWAFAGPHTQLSSYLQNWDHLVPRRETVACSLLRCLKVEQSRNHLSFRVTNRVTLMKVYHIFTLWPLHR